MGRVGEIERRTQERVIRLFEQGLGYEYLGSWQDREQNGNIEIELLSRWLERQKTGKNLVNRVIYRLEKAASLGEGRSLYDANKEVYELLRYGVKVKEEAGAPSTTVWLVDWQNPERNHFAISEEVTIEGRHIKRPDIVIYLNGIAIGVLELKRSTVSVSAGIRQTP